MSSLDKYVDLLGRILIVAIFVTGGLSKLGGGYEGTLGYMTSMGVPMANLLLPLVILVELGGAAAIILGWQTKWAALALAGFCIVSALIFHMNFADQMQMLMFMKNFAMAGGFLLLYVKGSGELSLDAKLAG